MSLTRCIKKAGAALNAEDKSAVLEFARRFRAEGKKADEAGIMAIEKQLTAVQQMMAEEQSRKPEPMEAPAAQPEAVAVGPGPGEEAAEMAGPESAASVDTTSQRVEKTAGDRQEAPLYASRSLTPASAQAIREWAASQGFKTTLPAEDLHVTVAYSREPMRGTDVADAPAALTVRGGKRSVEPLGDEGAVVLKFESQEMQARWKAYRDAGASWDYESYTPHVTITYDGKGVDLSAVEPYTGPIELGPERQEPLNVDKADDYREAGEVPSEPVPASAATEAQQATPAAPAADPARSERRRAAAEAVRKATVQRTNANSQMVWQIIGPAGEAMSGPPGVYPGKEGPLAGSAIRGQLGWKTKREAEAALAELNRMADEVLGQASAAAPTQSGAVENFGEALPPARRAMAAKLDESLSDDDIAKRPFSEIWPAAENDAIEDPFAAAVAHAARAEVPAKPRVAHKLRNWVQKVKTVRELAGMVVSGRVSREVLAQQIQGPRRVLADWWTKVQLLEQIPREQWKRIGAVEERPDASVMRGGAFVSAPIVRIQVDERSHWLSGDGTLAGSMDQIRALLKAPEPEQRMEFEVRQRRANGSVFVNKKGDPEYRPLMEFASVEEARAAIKEQYDALVGAWEAVKARDNITERDLRSAENRPRAGKDHRGGKDVTAEQFQQQFGFRGGEFGKWVQQGKGDKERQALLNSAYDALMDLADIVGVEPRAISLNGTLGIAFGSRGTGWASAHFEPSNLVINLTKTRGAGALAHEWFHALDNYFSRLRRGGEEAPFSGDKDQYRRENYITHSPEPLMVKKDGRWPPMTRAKLERLHQLHPSAPAYNPANWEVDPKAPRGVRPEVEARFAALVSVLTDSPMAKRSALISKSSSGYWTQTLELAARAFENYVQARMLEQGYHNDFLANVIAADDVGKSADRYPYLLAGEIPPVADAFAALFAELKTRQGDDGRLALYEPVPEGYTATNASPDAPTARDPGATPAPGGSGAPSAGRAAESEAAADESVRRAGGALPGGARFTALGIARQLDLAGSTALVGRTASTPDQLAELAQVYRNPRYETFRVFFTKGDTIVHATGVSARLPGLTPMVPWGMTTQEYLTQFRDLMQSTGADGYYILHNHPSGDPSPSVADENQTMFLAGQVPGMRAHVVINSNRYAVLSPMGDRRIEVRDFGPDTLLDAAIPSAILGRQIGSPQALVSLGKNLQRPGYVTLIGTSGPESKVRAVIEAPASLLGRSPVYLGALVRRLQRESGSSQMFLVGTSADISSRPVQRALSKGILRDAVADVGRTMAEQGLGGATGGFDKSRGRVQFSRSRPAVMVEQDEDGRPVILGQRVEMRFAQPTERLEVIEQPGEEVLHFPIMSAAGFDVLGHVILLVKDGKPTSLIDIEVYGKGEGVGRAAIETLLAAFPDSDLNISNIVPDARGFWEKMGIPQQNVEGAYDGTLNWETYQAAAGDRAGAGEVAQDGRGAGAQPFARGEGRGRGQSAPAPRAARGLTAARLGALVDRITANWANRPDIVVVESMQDPLVPEEVRREDQLQRSRGASGEPEGFFYKGKVYLVGAGLRTEADAIRVLFHETLGHAGLRGAFGKELATVLDLIAAGRPADMAEMARLYGKDLSKPGERRYVAEEVLAMLAQTRPEMGLVQRALAAIRNFLRRLGVQMELTDSDIIANFILPARGWVERGQGQAQGGAAQFSRSGGADIDRAWRDLTNSFKFSDFDTEPATKVTGALDDFVLSREQGKQWAALNVREMRRDDGRLVYIAMLEVGSEGFPTGTGAATTMYLQALNIAQKRGIGWQSDHIRSDNGLAIYKRLTEAGVPFKGDDGASYVTAEELAGVDLMAVAEKLADGRPMPAFSRSIPDTLAQRINDAHAIRLPAGYLLGDMLKSSGKLSWWHKTVGTMHNLAQREPLFRPVFDRVQRFLNDVSFYAAEAANAAPDLLPRLETLADITKSPLSAEDTQKISAPIFQGTLAWTRDERGQPIKLETAEERAGRLTTEQKAQEMFRAGAISEQVLKMWQGLPLEQYEANIESRYASQMLRGGVVWTDIELKSMFSLSDRQIKLYREFRAAVDKSLTQMTLSDMVRLAGADGEAVAERVMQAASVEDAQQLLVQAMDELVAQQPERADVLNDTSAKIIEKARVARDLMARGYAPLMRFGRYTVDVVDADGERIYFGLFETEREANKMARELAAEYPKARLTQGTLSEQQFKMFAGITPETAELFGNMLGLDSTGDKAADQAFQEWLKMAKANRSAMKRLIRRKGTSGFSEDAGRVLASFIYSNARQTSKNLHMGPMSQAVMDIAEEKGRGELLDAAVQLHDYVSNPVEEAQAIRGLLFAQFLGGSIAAALVNMTQPVMVTAPYLSQWGGVKKAANRMRKALADTVAWETGRKTTGDKVLDAAIKKAEEEGTISPQEIYQLMAQAGGSGALQAGDGTTAGNARAKAANAMSKLMLAWGKPFSAAEQFNRRATFIAAYRTAVEEGMPDPAAFAKQTIEDTQFVYNKGSRPQWARGAIGSILFTFKIYSISYVELMSRLVKQGPEGRRAALVGLAMLVLLSGLQGLPGGEDLDDLIDGLMQRLGYNWSTKERKREILAAAFGDPLSEFLMTGVSGLPGAPIDVSNRLGMGNLIPGTGLLTKKADYGRDLLEVLGPFGSLAKQYATAAGLVAEGEVAAGVKAALPIAAQNVVKAVDMMAMGMYRDDRGRKVIDTDATDAVFKAIGFQPRDVAQVQEAAFQQTRMVAMNKLRESEISEKWARGLFEQDSDKVREARDELRQWNEDNPDSPIRISDSQILRRVRQMRMSRQERVAATAPAEIRAAVRRELEESR